MSLAPASFPAWNNTLLIPSYLRSQPQNARHATGIHRRNLDERKAEWGGSAVFYWGASVNSLTDENHERAKGVSRTFMNQLTFGSAAEAERISRTVTGGGAGWDNSHLCWLSEIRRRCARRRVVPSFDYLDWHRNQSQWPGRCAGFRDSSDCFRPGFR